MATSSDLGVRSRLVLEKLGFDLQPYLEGTVEGPLPAKIQTLADELQGYVEWQDVGIPPRPEIVPEPALEVDDVRRLYDADRPFRFA